MLECVHVSFQNFVRRVLGAVPGVFLFRRIGEGSVAAHRRYHGTGVVHVQFSSEKWLPRLF